MRYIHRLVNIALIALLGVGILSNTVLATNRHSRNSFTRSFYTSINAASNPLAALGINVAPQKNGESSKFSGEQLECYFDNLLENSYQQAKMSFEAQY